MKFTLSWLKSHLETDKSADELAAKLTAIGLEVESVDRREIYAPFILAKIVKAEKHPNADKLQILQVDTGGEKLVQVVCGAPNARAGLVGVFAPPGATIPGSDIVLSVGKIRDAESFGMMCSERELLLSDEHDGIIELDERQMQAAGAQIGASFADYAGLSDPIIDVSLTPNRGDCASVYGIARDLAAAGAGRLKPLAAPALPKPAKAALKLALRVEDKENCLGFAAVRLDNLENRASPPWLQMRLRAAGLTPKNALVDISNYSGFDLGRPLHMFDADKVRGALCVRKAKKGEKLEALDGKIYELPENACVVADDSGVIALAGIMGGQSTACSAATRAVIIESALWNPLNIARTGRALGLHSEARYRFERGVDPAFMEKGLALAAAQTLELCGTEASFSGAPAIQAWSAPAAREISFPLSEITRLTGLNIAAAEARRLLEGLGFVCSGNTELMQIKPPSWRPDIEGKADIVEEVLRLYGLDKIAPQPLAHNYASGEKILTPLQISCAAVRRALAARSMYEAVTYSFIAAGAAEIFGGGQKELKLANPIAADMSDMRPSLLPNLLAAAARNGNRGLSDTALFELGDVYHSGGAERQARMAAGVRTGAAEPDGAGRFWSGNAAAVDCFTAKADALAALEAAGMAAGQVQAEAGAPAYYHPGRSGALKLGPKIILGYFGEFHPQTAEFFGLQKAACGFEIFLESVPQPRKKAAKTKPVLQISPFQQITRDFSFIVDESVGAAAILRAAAGVDKKLIAQAQVFDVFRSAAIGQGKKAVGIEIVLQPQTASLTDKELEAVSQKIIDNVLKSTKGTLRL